MGEHTPGPWKVKPDETITVRAADGSLIATLTHLTRVGRRDSKEVLANAHLFASAPDLKAENERLRMVGAKALLLLDEYAEEVGPPDPSVNVVGNEHILDVADALRAALREKSDG